MPILALVFSIVPAKLRWRLAAEPAVRAKSPCCKVVCSMIRALRAKTLSWSVNSLEVLAKPISIALASTAPAFNNTPNRRNGSDSPRKPAARAVMASSVLVSLNDAKSDARVVNSLLNPVKSVPVSPALWPRIAKLAAASCAATCERPRDLSAVAAHDWMALALSPKMTLDLLIDSLRLEAACTAE